MQVITTHIHADFDGLASMIAAQKIYPDAILVFPGSQEKNLREFISQTLLYKYDFQKLKTVNIADITELIVVDTRSSKRIGPFAKCLSNPKVKVRLYDHHPIGDGDITGDTEYIRDVGATTTILTELLQEQNIQVSSEEATIFALGIYEDTGSLTHLTTTPADLIAAAYLVKQGAQLDIVSQFISHDLTTQQVALLHELMKTAKRYTIQDIPIVVVTHSIAEYVDDFALIVRRFMIMENLDTLFALISMAGRIYLIARSRIADVNVGTIARDLGGGGHSTAASATVRDMTMIEAQDKLIQTLHRHILPQPIAKEMMSSPAITIPINSTITHAKEILTRYNITAVPVTSDEISVPSDPLKSKGVICGIISRMIIEKAIHHDLGHLLVGEYMTTDIDMLSLNATLSDIQELIIEHHQRLIPIVHNDELKGIITRTDLLNRLINDPAHLPKDQLNESEHPSLERNRNLNNIIVESLDKKIISLFRIIGEVADEFQCAAFAVGGIVRDLLLKKSNLDLDVVVEGNGIAFAQKLANVLNSKLVTHEKFNTAMIVMPDGFKIDIATARLEYYEYPAAMPTIELSSIKLDLYRRDFTINAMAIQLNPKHFGTLIDFFNCQNDLKHKAIKVLHNLSFVEDPTRIFRAIRLEQRMGFQIVQHTKRLIKSAVNLKLFGEEHYPRFFNELRIILSEENPIPAIHRMADFDLFQFLWPDLKPHTKIDRRFTHILNQAHDSISWFKLLYLDQKCDVWVVYLLTIMSRSTSEELKNFCTRFSVSSKVTETLIEQKKQVDPIAKYFSRKQNVSNSQIAEIFSELSTESLLYLMAIAKKNDLKKAISLYITTLSHIRPILSGKDLMKMGYKAGPQFKEILMLLKDARMDEVTTTKMEEIQLLQKHFPVTAATE